FYISSGDAAHLHASVRGVELTERDHLQVQGVPTGNEPVYGMGPMKETEHCDAVEWSFVGHSLLGATGEAKYADLAETALFNAWAGSRKWDGRSLCYNHAPNQITASAWEGTWLPRQCYSPYHDPQCCNLNSHRAIHPYAFRMWMLTSDGGPAAIYYGDCSLELDIVGAGRVAITEETGYPFDDEVKVTVTPERPARFTMSFRIPTWCQDAEVLLNFEPWPVSTKPGTLVGIDRVWNPGDRVDLRLPMSISLEYCETFEESQFHDPSQGPFDPALDSQQIGLRRTQEPDASSHLVAVRRGPLLYTLCIQPQRIVEPNDSHAEDYIVESILPTEDADPWNVALCLNANHPEDSFEFTHLDVPEDSAPFQHAPAALKCRARIIPNWKPTGSQEKPITSLPEFPVDACGLDVNVLLVPFGCTDIRLTWLPFVL
ncbi:MAG: beta-L-arabinofuranosidase domain-containing protein, partial [Armatimonadota bacterium]